MLLGLLLAATVVVIGLSVAIIVLDVRHTALTRADLQRGIQRTEAWIKINACLSMRNPLPLSTRYTASPGLLALLVDVVAETRPRRIVELGSGHSTIVMAYAVERFCADDAKIFSFDHDSYFAAQTRAHLERHGLGSTAEVVLAPLEPTTTDAGTSRWYRASAFAVLDEGPPIDLLVVDGPPGKDQPMARYPAWPALSGRVAPTVVVVVDDANRRDEREMVDDWASRDRFRLESWECEKGVVILRRVAPTTP